MEGKAIDAHFVDVGTARIRDIAMRMQAGGVGFYPSGAQPWVHIDSGPIRYWPRMSRDALARLFPDGKTVFIPADGQPMPGYEQARAEIEARGGEVQTAGGGGIFAWLFGARGGGADDAEEEGGGGSHGRGARRPRRRREPGSRSPTPGRTQSPRPSATCRPARPMPARSSRRPLPPPNRTSSMLGRTRSPRPSATCRSARPTPAPPSRDAAAGQTSGCRVAATGRRRERRFADRIGPKVLAPLPPRRPTDLDVAVALSGAPMPPARPANLVLTCGARDRRRRLLAGAVEQRARPRRRGRAAWLAAAGHHLRHRRRADRGAGAGGRLARAEI